MENLVTVLQSATRLSPRSLEKLYDAAITQLKTEPPLLRIPAPAEDGEARIVVVGDLHGQFADLEVV